MADDNNNQAETVSSKRVDLIQPGGFKAGTNLVTTSVPSVSCAATEVLVDIAATAINPVDWKMAEYGFFLAKEAGKPTALGCDIAGTIVAPDAAGLWSIGQRVVTYLGADKTAAGTTRAAFAHTTAVDADLVFAVPSGMTLPQAATLPVGGLTASALLQALTPAADGSTKDAWLLVWGASSSVGWSAIPLAVQQYGYKVIAVASAKHATNLTQQLGAAAVVDYKLSTEEMVKQVQEIVQGAPLNVAMDCIGTTESFSGSAAVVQACGGGSDAKRVVSTVDGQATPDAPVGIVKAPVMIGSLQGSRELVETAMPIVLKYCKPLKVRLVEGPVSAETVEKAFKIQKKGVSGEKVVIEWKKD